MKIQSAQKFSPWLGVCLCSAFLSFSAAAETKSFSVVPEFGQNTGGIIGSGTGQNKPVAEAIIPAIIGGIASGGFGQVQPGQGGAAIIGGGAGAGGNGVVNSPGASGGPVGGSAPPFGMVEQVRELTGSHGVATQSVMQGASNLTAAARSVQGMK